MSKRKAAATVPPSPAVRAVKWAGVLVALVFASILAAHHVTMFMGPKTRRGGELMSAGYYGQKIHVFCQGVTEGEQKTRFSLASSLTRNRSDLKTPIFALHHDNHLTCVNYLPLQETLLGAGHASCCLERPGFGLSPAPVFNAEHANLKAELTMLVEALVQVVGEEHTFVSVGHGAGGSYAWGAIRLAPKLHKGLIMLDGVTQGAFRSCPELSRVYARRPSPLQQALQLTGLRRIMAYFDSSGLWLPLQVPREAVALHRHLVLTDKMALASSLAYANTPAIANQLHVVTEASIPGVYIVADSERSKAEGFPFMECFNDAGAKYVQKYFKKSLVVPARKLGHFSLTVAREELLHAATFVLESSPTQ